MKLPQLKALCKQYNIKPGSKSTKPDIVGHIVKHSTTMNSARNAINDMLEVLKKPAIKDPAPLHNFYCTHFNLDDLTDKKWYAVEKCHLNHN